MTSFDIFRFSKIYLDGKLRQKYMNLYLNLMFEWIALRKFTNTVTEKNEIGSPPKSMFFCIKLFFFQ